MLQALADRSTRPLAPLHHHTKSRISPTVQPAPGTNFDSSSLPTLRLPRTGSIHLDEEIALERVEEKRLKLPKETWGVDELKHALGAVSDEEWFQEGGGMLNLRVLGPARPSTFRRVLADVPGAIYGCLQVWAVLGFVFFFFVSLREVDIRLFKYDVVGFSLDDLAG